MSPAPGWYDDNASPGVVRWFDGRGWTAHTAPAPSPAYAGRPVGHDQPALVAHDPLGPGEALHWIVPVGRSWQSVLAGYLGLVSLFVWVLGPFAVGLGVVGLRRARLGGHGSGRSVFAIVTGALACVFGVVFLVRALTSG